MKKFIFAIATAFLSLACTVVRYETPQPADVASLPQFPEKMQGLFISEDQDTLEVTQFKFHFRNGEEIQVKGDLCGNETVLREFKNYFILNLKDEEVWDVFPLRLKNDDLQVFFSATASRAEELMEELKEIAAVKEIADEDGDLEYYLIAPTSEEFRRLMRKGLFDERLLFKRLK
ncbi:hypothetical protein V6B16_09905 [Salinimicrobium catena]|uniref:hypothetical protein n=1 Tax=Salinimicrobium catena TaxID=390640 RepID=UPI002FE472DE